MMKSLSVSFWIASAILVLSKWRRAFLYENSLCCFSGRTGLMSVGLLLSVGSTGLSMRC